VSIGNTDKADGIGGFRLVACTEYGLRMVHFCRNGRY
jgi:hypothetical protein